MNEHDDPVENVLLDRLRAADPATGSFTDLDRLRQKVDARIAADPEDDDAPAGPPGPTATVTEIGAVRSRSRWLSVAAVAAAAAVVGATGFGLGRGTAEPTPGAAPPVGLTSGADGSVTSGRGTSGWGAESAMSDASLTWPSGFGRVTFQGAGLSDEGGSATAWAFDPTTSFTGERVTQVAAALGIDEAARLVDGSWQAGATDGTAPYVMVHQDSQSGLTFYNPAADPFQCLETVPMPVEPGGEAAVEPEAAERDAAGGVQCENNDLGPAPGAGAATDQVRALLGEMGLDPATYELETTEHEDPAMTSVTAYQVVGGQRTGAAWWFDLTGAGLLGVNGALAPLTELGAYPVVSATEAVARLNDPRFGSIGGVTVADSSATADGAEASGDVAVGSPPRPGELPAPTAPGSSVPWPVEQVTITSARLGVGQHFTPTGAALLVPAYELTADDGRTWSVIAIAESALDLTPAP